MRLRASGALITSCQSSSGPADKQFQLLKADPQHPSLHFKRVGRFHSVRVGAHYRALAVHASDGLLWFWIGTHAEYDRIAG
jgi:hypothetical protein